VLNGERAAPGLATTLSAVTAGARQRGAECSRRARQHDLSYRRWRLWNSLLGVAGAIGTAVAAALLLLGETGGARAVIGGLIALVAAGCVAANTVVIQTRVEEHRIARELFSSLHARYLLLGDLPPRDLVTARLLLEDIERSHAELEVKAPAPDAPAPEPLPSPPDAATDGGPTARLEPPVAARPGP